MYLPVEERKFSLGNQVIVDACKSTERTGTVVGIKYIAGFSGGKHFVSYTVELSDKSLVLRNARSLKMCTPEPHPNKQEILAGIASGREWEFRGAEMDEWLSSPRHLKSPSWLPNHEYRLTPEPEYVPLGPEDVPPFSVIRRKEQTDEYGKPQYWHWRLISYVTGIGPACADRGYNWQELSTGYEINRSLPLTGKWNPDAWELCKKLKQ